MHSHTPMHATKNLNKLIQQTTLPTQKQPAKVATVDSQSQYVFSPVTMVVVVVVSLLGCHGQFYSGNFSNFSPYSNSPLSPFLCLCVNLEAAGCIDLLQRIEYSGHNSRCRSVNTPIHSLYSTMHTLTRTIK